MSEIPAEWEPWLAAFRERMSFIGSDQMMLDPTLVEHARARRDAERARLEQFRLREAERAALLAAERAEALAAMQPQVDRWQAVIDGLPVHPMRELASCHKPVLSWARNVICEDCIDGHEDHEPWPCWDFLQWEEAVRLLSA